MKTKTMRKLVAFTVAFAFAMSSALPAIAQTTSGNDYDPADIGTEFDISTAGSGDAPIVKAKWEEETYITPLESGDTTHQVPGTQIYPPLDEGVDKMITICSVVTDYQGLGTIATVKAWVDYPEVLPYCKGLSPYPGPFVLTKAYNPDTQANAAIARVLAANNAGLITYQQGFNYNEVWGELNNGGAAVYCGDFPLNYEDPAGEYTVEVKAQDTSNMWGMLTNHFDYVPVAGFEVDFGTVDYGIVTIGQEKQVLGNGVFGPDVTTPTVRGIGNMMLNLTVRQNAMGLPLGTDVAYAARMGNTEATKVSYGPNTTVTLPEVLGLSGISKMDFWITVYQTIPNQIHYVGDMTIGSIPVDFAACD